MIVSGDTQELEILLLREVNRSSAPTGELIDRIRQRDPELDPASLRFILWNLVSRGKLRFNQDWRVESV